MNINIHHHYVDTKVRKLLKILTSQNLEIMATLQELVDKVEALQNAIDAEQAQIAAVIEDLQQTVVDLQAIIDAGVTPEQLDGVIASIDASIEDLRSTIVADGPGEEDTENPPA
jgi:DNA-binding protein H-NS